MTRLLDADERLEEAEKNMLFEAMEKVGIVVPMTMQMADVLTQDLSANLLEEIEEIKNSSLIGGSHLLWPDY